MPSVINTNIRTEVEYLKQASIYVGRSEIENAIFLLERARLLLPVTNRLINVLGKLYLTVGKSAQAADCFEIVLNRKSKVEKDLHELPKIEDIQYLVEQSEQLNEKEYFFDISAQEKLEIRRKILSLNGKKSTKNIIFKNKKREVFSENSASIQIDDKDFKSINANILDFNQVEIKDELIVTVDDFYTPQLLSKNYEDDPVGHISVEQNSNRPDIDELSDYGVNLGDDLDDLDDLMDEVIDDVFTFNENIEASFIDLSNLAVDSEWTLNIYDHWHDDPQEEVEEVEDWALDDYLSREERARQAAVQCIEHINWDKSKLSFLTEVFIEFGWSNAKTAFEREVLAGATYEELCLAFQVKQQWKECERYWICFSGAWIPGESTVATYRHCSWPQALRLIRLFDGIPDLEELWGLLENEFDYWYSDRVLRARFPAFSRYLFSYRFNDSLPTLHVNELRRFDVNVSFDEMNASWSYHTQSDELRILSEFGIDVINRSTPKSYYTSDIIFDLEALNLPSSKRNSMEKISDDEKF